MAQEVTAGDTGVEYRFPVEVEVRTTLAQADLDRLMEIALASLANAVRSA
jgi:hypothetical protein